MKNKRTAYLIIFAIVFIDMVGFGILIPLLPYYGKTFTSEIHQIARFFGTNMTPEGLVIAVLFSVYSFMQFIFSPVWGRLSDRWGRKPILLLNLFGSVFAYILFGLAGSLWILFLSRVFQGIFGAKIATAQAYIADITTKEDRAKGMGLVGAALGLGFIFGPAIAGILISLEKTALSIPFFDMLLRHNIYALPGYFAALISLINFGLVYLILPETIEAGKTSQVAQRRLNLSGLKKAMNAPNLSLLLTIIFLVTIAFSAMESTFALWGNKTLGITEKMNSYLFAYIGVLIAIVQGGLIGKLAQKFGETKLVITGIISMAAGLFLIPLSPTIGILMLVLIPLALGNGLNTPSINSLISQVSNASDYGGTLGVSRSVTSLGRIVGPLIGGFVFDEFGVQYPFIIGAIIMLVAFTMSWRLLRRHLEVALQD